MKKILSLLFTLLIFVGNAWGDYTFIYPSSVEVATAAFSTKKTSVSLGGTASITAFACSLKTNKKATYAYLYIGTSDEAKNLYEGNPGGGKTTKIYHSKNISTSVSTIHFTNNNPSASRTCSDMVLTIDDTSIGFNDTQCGNNTTQTFNYFFPKENDATSVKNILSSNNSAAFTVVSVKSISKYCYEVTIKFTPTDPVEYTGKILRTSDNAVVANVSGTGTLPAPESVSVTPYYDNASLTWSPVKGADGYEITYGDSIKTVGSGVTSITCDALELDTNYTFSVRATKSSTKSAPKSVDGKTNSLAASASFTISDATYTTCQGTWAQIPNATGYKVVASNGAVTYFEGSSTTSGTIAGLLPNNSYTCTVYGMYNKAVSKNGKTSNSINTLTTNCPPESLGSANIESQGGFNWDDKYSKTFTTSKNQATISFQFNTSTDWATGAEYFVEESADGSTWTRKSWTSTSQSGSGSVTLSRGKFKFRFVYSGNFGATISEVHAVQASYMEVSTTSIDFGNIVYGNSASETITIPFSTMVSNITTTNPYYTFDRTSVGDDDCSYGTETLKITFNKNKDAAIGEQNTTIYIGSNAINITATITLPVPELSLSSKSYQNVVLSWGSIAGAERYRINCAGKEPVWINAADFEGSYTYGGLLQNTEYTFTVQAYGGGKSTDESNAITTKTLSLAAPTIEASNIRYDIATLTWSVVEDAADYELYDERTGERYIFTKGTNSVAIDTLSLHTSYTYRIYSRLADETRSLTYGTVTFSTTDLQPSTSFTLSNISYNAMDAAWAPVEDATGYMIRERWTRMVLTFGADETSTTIYGLKPGTLYEFYLYATYNEAPATDSHRISAKGTTLEPNCPVQVVEDHTFGCDNITKCGFDWNDKTLNIDITKNAPILSFNYEIAPTATKDGDDLLTYGPYIRVEEYNNGSWNEVWRFTRSKDSRSGSAQIDNLQRTTRKVRIIYHGNLWCNVSGITISQGTYFTLDKSSLPFGEHYVGAASVTQTVTADYSSQAASVVSSDTELFSSSKETLGDGECGYGTDDVTMTANTALEPGEYNAELVIGRTHLPMSVTILELPAPNNFVIAEQNPTSAVLTWDDVNITESGYKVICKQGDNVIETKNLGGDATTCTFEGLQPNKEYTYIITTMYNSIENESAEITGKTNMLPAPQNFALDVTSVRAFSAIFTWTKVTNATGYKLEWQWNEEVAAQTATVGDVSEYKITELEPDTKYSVKITTLYGDEEHGASDNIDVTTTCVINTIATGDEPHNQLHTVTLLSGEQLDDLSFVKGSTIKFKSYTNSTNIKFVQLNVTINGSKVSYSVPEIEIEVSSNVFIESVYEYAGIAQVVDEHGDVVYGTLTDAVNAAEEGATINLLGDVEQDMVVNKYIKFNGNGHDIDNLYIKKNGNVELTGDVTVVKDFGLEVSAARSGQFLENGGQIQVTGRAYIDKVLEENGVGDYNKWYSVAVPFQVSIKDGIYIVGNDGSETKAKFNSDYAMFEYDGALRAAGTSRLPEWVLADSEKNMKVGTFYLFGLGKSGPNVFRFYKADNAELITLDKTLTLTEYASSKSIDAGWNGIGNSQLYHVGIETTEYQYAQVLENNKFTTVDIAETSFAVTTPMFIQAAGDGSVSLNPKKDGTLRSASVSSAVYNIRLAKEGAEKYSDQMFASASSDATGSYTIGRDLVKFEVSTAYPQLYTRGFNTNLSVHEAAYNELSIAEMPLYMFAPEAGNYTLSLGKEVSDGSALYLVKNGAEIHNFNADGAYTLYLAKGTDSSYTLRIKGENGDIPTPVIDNKAGKVNVYIEEGVLVIEGLDNGESYMVGNTIRTLYSGVSSGNNIRIALPERGIYLVNAKESKVKILNK